MYCILGAGQRGFGTDMTKVFGDFCAQLASAYFHVFCLGVLDNGIILINGGGGGGDFFHE